MGVLKKRLRPLATGVVVAMISPLAGVADPAGDMIEAPPVFVTSNDVPISQSVMDDGSLRYSVWIKVGSRFVEAMVDTGSTGLRVLPAVVPGDLEGLPVEASYGSGVKLKGVAVVTQVEIGGLSASVPIQVVDGFGCTTRTPDCAAKKRGSDYLIAGGGASGRGFSAILGIGFTARSQDIPNPLEVMHAAQWMIELPRPGDQDPGHLLLKPDAGVRAPFKMFAGTKYGDLSGCLQTDAHDQDICGPVLLDTGAPGLVAISEDREHETVWPGGTSAILRFSASLKMRFETATDMNDPSRVAILTAKQKINSEIPFILGGLLPYQTFDVLYDSVEHKVGLKLRKTAPVQDRSVQQDQSAQGGPAPVEAVGSP